ncbi:TonB-dependent receptor [Novosphingobium sp. ST904]|uniref:TonB-dependent receptor n=1 Tax=Novosphingobium sp. ST904 TaxID=1684385 RepID=UPI0009EB9286|nr:TonB-dependent receptor [Novosphingobium sp. ST904]TCM35389.1 outer membrane receptor protein involved in Fe transport [Novosphingobium sp. ST904]
MTGKLKRTALTTSLIATAAMLATAPAQAQQAGDAEGGNTIVVTAKNRKESLQDVPLAITALSDQDLAGAQIRDARDLQKITPNLSLFAGSGRNDPSAYSLRGLAPNTSDERYQGISIFIDGVALSGQLASLDLENLQRVEIIKGPQSATFGRATYSGAINYVTADPSGDAVTGFVKARGSLTNKAPDASYYFGGTITAPIVKDALWFSVSGSLMQNGAFAKSVDDGTAIGRERTQVVSGTLFFKPDESFSIKLRGMYQHDRDSPPAQVVQHPREWLAAGVAVAPFARGNGAFFPAYLPDGDLDTIGTQGATGYGRDRYFASAVVTKTFGDYELSYRGGYFRESRWANVATVPRAVQRGKDPVFGDLITDGTVTVRSSVLGTFPSTETFENTSHQLMLLSPGSKPFRWRAGLYYFWENDLSAFSGYGTTANPKGVTRNDHLTNMAVLGGFDWDVTDALTLSGEGRYAREKVSSPACPTCVFYPTSVDYNNVSEDFSPRITLSYKVTGESMIYALFSKGVKSARYSFVNVGGNYVGLAADPEKLFNYEIGSKNTFFGGRLTLNLAAFYDEVKDQQLVSTQERTVNGNIVNIATVGNVGASKILGFEGEANLRITPRLTLRGSVGYAHQEFTTKTPLIISTSSTYGFPASADNSIVLDGLTQANVPDWNGFIGGEYKLPEMGGFSPSFRLDGAYRGSWYANLANTVKGRSAWTVDARINFASDAIDFSLFGRNILNNQRPTGSGLAGATATCIFVERDTATYGSNQQCLYASVPRPAEWGMEATLRF